MNKNFHNKNIKVALIDSGITRSGVEDLGNVVYQVGYNIGSDNKVLRKSSEIINEHGTAISLIMSHICPKIELYSFQILDDKLTACGNQLISALEHCIKIKPNIIHLSLGTTNTVYKSRLKRIVRRANKMQIIIVCAKDNHGQKSYPSCLNGTIAVEGLAFRNINNLKYKNETFFAPIGLTNIKNLNKLNNYKVTGNSFAAAYVTGHIGNLIDKYKLNNVSLIKKLLFMGIKGEIYNG